MSWFSNIVGDLNSTANSINPFKGVTDATTKATADLLPSSVGKPLGQAALWGDSHPAQVGAAIGAAFGGGALLGVDAGAGAGAGAGLDAADAGLDAGAGAGFGAGVDSVGTLGAADAGLGAGTETAGLLGDSALGGADAGGFGALGLDSSSAGSAGAFGGAGGALTSAATGGDAFAGSAGWDSGAAGGFDGAFSPVDASGPSTASGFGGVGTDPGVAASPDGGLALGQQAGGGASTSSAVQDALKTALKYGPAGVSLLRSVMGQGAYAKAAGQLSNVGATQRATANGLVQGYNNGTLNPAESAGIDTWATQQVSALRQFYANAGTADSTQAKQAEAAVMAQATQMKNQATQNLLTVGLNELNSLDANTVAGIKVNLQGDQAATQAQANFAAQFAKLIGSQQSGVSAPSPAGG